METNCAVCRLSDGLVLNLIVAALSDTPPDGCELIEVMAMQPFDIGWIWDGTAFNPPVG